VQSVLREHVFESKCVGHECMYMHAGCLCGTWKYTSMYGNALHPSFSEFCPSPTAHPQQQLHPVNSQRTKYSRIP